MLLGNIDFGAHGCQQMKIKFLLLHFPVENAVLTVFQQNADLTEFRCDVIQDLLGAQLEILEIVFVKVRVLLLHEGNHDLCHNGNVLCGNAKRELVAARLFVGVLKALHLV